MVCRYLCIVQPFLVGKEVELVVLLGAREYIDVIKAFHSDTEVWLLGFEHFHNGPESEAAEEHRRKGENEIARPKERREVAMSTLGFMDSAWV